MRLLVCGCLAALSLAATATAAGLDCRTAARPGACFDVRGVLRPANGSPALRIRATNGRTLGVVGGDGDPDTPALPADLRAAMQPPTPGSLLSVRGKFRVCPLAPERARHMRPVCIAAASDLAALPRTGP
ncbi:MAG TPA: hypothetical protein VMT68_18715 [Caulobacteraceae bacterium]|nr:hypothetical protein [Caulobacteraceae bacterium]